MLLGTLGMIAIYPMALSSAALWALFAAVATAALRENLCSRLWGRRLRETVSPRAFWGLCFLCHPAVAGANGMAAAKLPNRQ